MNESPFNEWKEVAERKAGFQALIGALVEYDDRTARYRRFGEPEQHFFRKAIVHGDPADLRVFLKKLRGYVYYVVVEIRTEHGFCATSWVHEDGVQLERDTLAAEPSHPVHGIDCLSDFYRRFSTRVIGDVEDVTMADSTLDLMFSEVSWRRPPFVA